MKKTTSILVLVVSLTITLGYSPAHAVDNPDLLRQALAWCNIMMMNAPAICPSDYSCSTTPVEGSCKQAWINEVERISADPDYYLHNIEKYAQSYLAHQAGELERNKITADTVAVVKVNVTKDGKVKTEGITYQSHLAGLSKLAVKSTKTTSAERIKAEKINKIRAEKKAEMAKPKAIVVIY